VDSIRDTVLRLRREGYSMIPSGKGDDGKHPAVSWKAYQTGLPLESDFRSWLRQKNRTLWGQVTGEAFDVVVVDLDAGADQTIMNDLKPHIKTPHGAHYWFHHPGHHVESKRYLPSIDVKADGGFANVVGKNPVTGGEYVIEIFPSRDRLYKWEQMPKPILEAMEGSSEAEPVRSEPIVTEIFEHEGRNVAVTRESGRLLNMYKDHYVARMLAYAYNEAVCRPPLSEKECADSWEKSLAKWDDGAPPTLRSADEIEAREVEWLWEPYIPLGKLTMLDGDPGEGKSWISLAIATRITLADLGGPANILIASAEDDWDDTIRPRLEELGANLGLIYAIEEPFTLGSKKEVNEDAFGMLERYLREKDPALLIIDPLTAYLGSGIDMHRQNETRPVMTRLASIARDHRCAILLIRHITKGGSVKPIYRGMGSIDFMAASRSALLAGHVDHEDGSVERALVHIKCNLAALGPPLGFILGHPFQWTDSTLTASEILDQPIGGGRKTDEAVVLIRELLAGDEAVPAKEIFAVAKEAGISEKTMKNAKKVLHVKSGKKEGKWHWYLPKGKEAPPDLEPLATVKDGRISVDLDAV